MPCRVRCGNCKEEPKIGMDFYFWLIRGCQPEHIPDFCADCPPPVQTHSAPASKKRVGIQQIHPGTITERFPVKAVRAIEQNSMRFGLAILPLTGAIERVHHGSPRTKSRVRNQDNRMLPFFREVETPHVKLVFHGTCSELPLASAASSRLLFAFSPKS